MTWRLDDRGRPGVVLSGDQWNETAGRFRATVNWAGEGPIVAQVWDLTSGKLLAERSFLGARKRTDVLIPFKLGHQNVRASASGLTGSGPFEMQIEQSPPGHTLEIRVIDPHGSLVDVYTVAVSPVKKSMKS
jgi:hypothetical protein